MLKKLKKVLPYDAKNKSDPGKNLLNFKNYVLFNLSRIKHYFILIQEYNIVHLCLYCPIYSWRSLLVPAANFVSEKAKRDRHNKRTLWKKLILPEINVPMKVIAKPLFSS